MEEKKLPPLIQKLADAIEEKGLKVQFGLEQQGHVPTIEKMLTEFGSARSEHIWKKIGEAIGWEYKTAAFFYIEYLRERAREDVSSSEVLPEKKEANAEAVCVHPYMWVHRKGDYESCEKCGKVLCEG